MMHRKMYLVVACVLGMYAVCRGSEIRGIHGWYESQGLTTKTQLSSETHRLHFWFKYEAPELLDEYTEKITNPSSEHYREWIDDNEIRRIVAPKEGAVEALSDFLDESLEGEYALTMSKHNDFAHVDASIAAWNKLFDINLVKFRNDATSEEIVRQSGSHHVRTEASDHAYANPRLSSVTRAVFGISDFYPIPTRRTPSADTVCKDFKGEQIDPNVIAARYKIEAPPVSGRRPGYGLHSQGVAAFEQAQFFEKDVAQFQDDYNLSRVNVSIVGPNNGGYYGEASLDTQYIFATGSGVETYYLSQTKFDLLEWSWLTMNLTKPPTVLSISWGSGESGFDRAHMHATSLEFQKIGLTGRTILTASGDDGTGGHGGLLGCKDFDTTWPASSPFVTAVGGTYLTDDGSTETGWSSSGGGFSSVFERPSYQDDAVASYVKKTKLPPQDHFNISGRVTPDVSAASTNFRLVTLGAYGCLSGTSASTPVVAGMISLINDDLVSRGKPTVGFINPTLYAAGNIGYDITSGNNKGQFCPSGFNAEEGFDAVTGIGSPLFETLKKVLAPV